MRAVRWNGSVLRAGIPVFVAILASCGGRTDLPTQPGGGGAIVTQIVVSPDGGTITAGQTMTFAAVAKDASGNPVNTTLTWSVGDAAIASVAQGVVTARTPGKTSLSASNGAVSGTVSITVVAAIDHIDVAPSPDSVIITQTSQLTATPRDAAGASLSGRTVTWSSSNDAVASVSATGVVTAKTLGSATITATAEGKSGTTLVVVRPIPVSTVSIATAAGAVTAGDVVSLSATLKDSTGAVIAGRPITWTSSDISVATIAAPATGATIQLSTKAAGTTTITAASEGKSGTLVVTVQPIRTATVVISATPDTIAAARTVQLTATPTDAQGQPVTGRTITWSTSDAAIATVSSTGLVTAVSQGQVTITASADGKSGKTTKTVVDLTPPRIIGLSISPSANIDVTSQAQTVTFAAIATDAGGSGVQRVNFAIVAPNGGSNTCSGVAPEPGGTRFSGTFKCSITVPVGAPAGDWTFSIVALDAALNTVSLGAAELRAANLPTKFTVLSSHPDTTPPSLVGQINYSRTSVDVSAGPQSITVAAHLTDGGSGVSRFDFQLKAPNGVSTVGCSALAPNPPGNAADGTWQCTVTIPAGAQPGPWSIQAAAVDASFNTNLILPPEKITVADAAPDVTPPALTSLTITPQPVDVTYGAQVVTVSGHVTDAQSGVAQFTLKGAASNGTTVECGDATLDLGTVNDGMFSCRFTLPSGVPVGDWLVSVQVADKALNFRQYGTTELGKMGMPTKFTVVNRAP